MNKTILLINGPNLNLLGKREPDIYGEKTLKEIEEEFSNIANCKGFNVKSYQSNSESDLINFIHENLTADFIIINPAALTHTSIALRDALLGVNIPFIEVHLSNIYSREEFRKKSYLSDISSGVIVGFKDDVYYLALNMASKIIS